MKLALQVLILSGSVWNILGSGRCAPFDSSKPSTPTFHEIKNDKNSFFRTLMGQRRAVAQKVMSKPNKNWTPIAATEDQIKNALYLNDPLPDVKTLDIVTETLFDDYDDNLEYVEQTGTFGK